MSRGPYPGSLTHNERRPARGRVGVSWRASANRPWVFVGSTPQTQSSRALQSETSTRLATDLGPVPPRAISDMPRLDVAKPTSTRAISDMPRVDVSKRTSTRAISDMPRVEVAKRTSTRGISDMPRVDVAERTSTRAISEIPRVDVVRGLKLGGLGTASGSPSSRRFWPAVRAPAAASARRAHGCREGAEFEESFLANSSLGNEGPACVGAGLSPDRLVRAWVDPTLSVAGWVRGASFQAGASDRAGSLGSEVDSPARFGPQDRGGVGGSGGEGSPGGGGAPGGGIGAPPG
jgi:hypothetical protein